MFVSHEKKGGQPRQFKIYKSLTKLIFSFEKENTIQLREPTLVQSS